MPMVAPEATTLRTIAAMDESQVWSGPAMPLDAELEYSVVETVFFVCLVPLSYLFLFLRSCAQ